MSYNWNKNSKGKNYLFFIIASVRMRKTGWQWGWGSLIHVSGLEVKCKTSEGPEVTGTTFGELLILPGIDSCFQLQLPKARARSSSSHACLQSGLTSAWELVAWWSHVWSGWLSAQWWPRQSTETIVSDCDFCGASDVDFSVYYIMCWLCENRHFV